jgi:ferredoxin
MTGDVTAPRLSPRQPAGHRPELDPACAGCPQLGLLRALRRCRIEASGRLGCEAGGQPLLADHLVGGARIRVLAGSIEPIEPTPPGRPAPAVVRLDPADLEAAEAALREALARPGETLVLAIAPCRLGAPRAAPLAVTARRCNRCGQCLSLGCPSITDAGGEAMVVDPGTCAGCGLCRPLCRSRALAPRPRGLDAPGPASTSVYAESLLPTAFRPGGC